MGWGGLGCHGAAIPTPHIDALAARGVRAAAAILGRDGHTFAAVAGRTVRDGARLGRSKQHRARRHRLPAPVHDDDKVQRGRRPHQRGLARPLPTAGGARGIRGVVILRSAPGGDNSSGVQQTEGHPPSGGCPFVEQACLVTTGR
ncbi:hypothetical protein [Micromonospora sp. NPDC047074]|uniref:hypothetical protein n=1 Tax=Micromonospora sp. NPDC047074 TaxID=3154339 RepID=UPI00340FA47F